VSPEVAFVLLLAATVAWFLLPLLPALSELLRPTDIAPLQVVGRDAGDVALFARGFRAYLNRQVQNLPTDTPAEVVGTLPDRTPFVRGRRLPDQFLAEASRDQGLDRVVILTAPAAFAGGETFVRELYATEAFAGGPRGVYRAVLGDAGVTLGPRTAVLRWVHARGDLLVGDGSILSGRASADQAIRLGSRVGFDRLAATRISVTGGASLPELPVPAPVAYAIPESQARPIGDHLRIEGDLVIPAAAVLTANLVVTGSMVLGASAHLVGSLKAHGAVRLEDGAHVDGAVVSRRSIETGMRVSVGGPVVSEEEVRLGDGTTVGQPHRPTSIAAPRIELGAGTTVHGLITATEGGITGKAAE